MSTIAWVGFKCCNGENVPFKKSNVNSKYFELKEYTKKDNPFHLIKLIIALYDKKSIGIFLCLKNIKQLNPSIPIILVANEYQTNIAIQALRTRMWDVVFLPNEKDYLQDKIDEILNFDIKIDKKNVRDIIFPAHEIHDEIIKKENEPKTDLAIMHITKHYNGIIRVKELAEICKLSQEKFTKFFREEHGCTVREYLKLYRIAIAKCLLIQTNFPIDQVAYKSGFENVSLFNRLFLECVGYTPSEFRLSL